MSASLPSRRKTESSNCYRNSNPNVRQNEPRSLASVRPGFRPRRRERLGGTAHTGRRHRAFMGIAMRKSRTTVMILFFALAVSLASAQSPPKTEDAKKAANDWLALVDTSKYADSWQSAA